MAVVNKSVALIIYDGFCVGLKVGRTVDGDGVGEVVGSRAGFDVIGFVVVGFAVLGDAVVIITGDSVGAMAVAEIVGNVLGAFVV